MAMFPFVMVVWMPVSLHACNSANFGTPWSEQPAEMKSGLPVENMRVFLAHGKHFCAQVSSKEDMTSMNKTR